MNLARIEMMALFTELAKRVRRFTIEEEKRIPNNVLRGFTTCVSPSADTTARSIKEYSRTRPAMPCGRR